MRARWLLWQPWKTLARAAGLGAARGLRLDPVHLRAARAGRARLGRAVASATHALTVGAIGGLIIGMMTRTARGHTGRPLRRTGCDIACYVLVLAAALVRVVVPLALPQWTIEAIVASAGLWSSGFALYAACYWPVLTRPRLDGKPG